jgi:hypothetical protein
MEVSLRGMRRIIRSHDETLAMLATSRAQAIACNNGHILSGLIVPYGLAFDARFDEDREIGEGGIGGLLRECALRKKL